MNDPRFSGINLTVLNLIDVLGEILMTGYIPENDPMFEYVQDSIEFAKRDLNYREQPDD